MAATNLRAEARGPCGTEEEEEGEEGEERGVGDEPSASPKRTQTTPRGVGAGSEEAGAEGGEGQGRDDVGG